MLKEKIKAIKNSFLEEIGKIKDNAALFNLEKKYVGRKSQFGEILKNIKNLTPEEKREIGELANETKNEIISIINSKKIEISANSFDLEKEKIDVTIPGKKRGIGHLNPISIVRAEIEEIFISMGFEIADGPEIENEFYNFDALNVPPDHPAREMWDTLLTTGQWRGEIWNRRKGGEAYPAWLTISSITDELGRTTNYVSVFSDISSVKNAQQQIEFLAHHDALTCLPNRTLFHDRLAHGLQRAQRDGSQMALLYLDLDRFKNVNDTLGHPVGDELLQDSARRLAGAIRAGDTLARFGGDEFVLLLEVEASALRASVVAKKLLELLTTPMHIAGHDLVVTTSIGICQR